MFTKDKLEKQIDALDHELIDLEHRIILLVKSSGSYRRLKDRKDTLEELKKTLEQIYTSITSDGSI